MTAVGHCEAINPGFNIYNRRSVSLEPRNINLNIEVPDARGRSIVNVSTIIELKGLQTCRQWRPQA